jgi:hypothetical protein
MGNTLINPFLGSPQTVYTVRVFCIGRIFYNDGTAQTYSDVISQSNFTAEDAENAERNFYVFEESGFFIITCL